MLCELYQTISDKYAAILEKFMPDLKLFCIKNTAIYKHGGTMKWNDFRKWYRDNANN